MKPRNKYEKQVAASNGKLTAISPKAVSWAVKNTVEHPAFRTSGHKCTCGDCGKPFGHRGKGRFTKCPHCGARLNVTDTMKRKFESSSYFSVMETIDGLQVQRTFRLNVNYYKGKPLKAIYDEVCRLWLNARGKLALTARMRTSGYYLDSFSFASGVELRKLTEVHRVISDNHVYPRYSAIHELRRNGLKGKLPACHPIRLMKALLTDHRIETMMKAGDYKAVEYYVHTPSALDLCWNSYKIATRHGYKPEDYGLWSDTVRLLDKSGRDIRSTKYICPVDLPTAHIHWLKKVNIMEEKMRQERQLQEAKRQEAKFYKEKSCFFGIVIKDDDLEISVLDSLEAYKNEGDQLKHCVFQCEYYAKTDSIILSAHDKNHRKIETVEFSLTEGKVIQSRGICNSNTGFHDRIIELVNDNAHRFLKAKETA